MAKMKVKVYFYHLFILTVVMLLCFYLMYRDMKRIENNMVNLYQRCNNLDRLLNTADVPTNNTPNNNVDTELNEIYDKIENNMDNVNGDGDAVDDNDDNDEGLDDDGNENEDNNVENENSETEDSENDNNENDSEDDDNDVKELLHKVILVDDNNDDNNDDDDNDDNDDDDKHIPEFFFVSDLYRTHQTLNIFIDECDKLDRLNGKLSEKRNKYGNIILPCAHEIKYPKHCSKGTKKAKDGPITKRYENLVHESDRDPGAWSKFQAPNNWHHYDYFYKELAVNEDGEFVRDVQNKGAEKHDDIDMITAAIFIICQLKEHKPLMGNNWVEKERDLDKSTAAQLEAVKNKMTEGMEQKEKEEEEEEEEKEEEGEEEKERSSDVRHCNGYSPAGKFKQDECCDREEFGSGSIIKGERVEEIERALKDGSKIKIKPNQCKTSAEEEKVAAAAKQREAAAAAEGEEGEKRLWGKVRGTVISEKHHDFADVAIQLITSMKEKLPVNEGKDKEEEEGDEWKDIVVEDNVIGVKNEYQDEKIFWSFRKEAIIDGVKYIFFPSFNLNGEYKTVYVFNHTTQTYLNESQKKKESLIKFIIEAEALGRDKEGEVQKAEQAKNKQEAEEKILDIEEARFAQLQKEVDEYSIDPVSYTKESRKTAAQTLQGVIENHDKLITTHSNKIKELELEIEKNENEIITTLNNKNWVNENKVDRLKQTANNKSKMIDDLKKQIKKMNEQKKALQIKINDITQTSTP